MPLQGPLPVQLHQGRVRAEQVRQPQVLSGLLLRQPPAAAQLPGVHRRGRVRERHRRAPVPGHLVRGKQELPGGRDEQGARVQRREQVQVLRVREVRQGGQQDSADGPVPDRLLHRALVTAGGIQDLRHGER